MNYLVSTILSENHRSCPSEWKALVTLIKNTTKRHIKQFPKILSILLFFLVIGACKRKDFYQYDSLVIRLHFLRSNIAQFHHYFNHLHKSKVQHDASFTIFVYFNYSDTFFIITGYKIVQAALRNRYSCKITADELLWMIWDVWVF